MEEFYAKFVENLLTRIDIETVKMQSRNAKTLKMETNLNILADEMNEYNTFKVESRKMAQTRLVQSLKMHVKHGNKLADRGIWDLRKDHIQW